MQRSTGTFRTGLPDGEIMLENPRKRPKGVDMRQITEYRPVPGAPVVFSYIISPSLHDGSTDGPVW